MRSIEVHLRARAPDVARWDGGEAPAWVVKAKHDRTVWRVEAGTPALYVKRFPPSLFRDRARKEARLLRQLAEAGLPCPRLVATARDRAGTYVVTEEVPEAVVLKSLLAARRDVRRLLGSLAHLFRRLCDAGFDHRDLHVGNVLVRGSDMYVLDVHRARRVRVVSVRRRTESAAFTAMTFRDLVPLTEVARFFRACGLWSKAERLDAFRHLDRLSERRLRRRERKRGRASIADIMRMTAAWHHLRPPLEGKR